MKTSTALTVLLLSLALAGAGGYWLGIRGGSAASGPSAGAPGRAGPGGPGGAGGGMGGMSVLAAKVEVMPLPQTINAVGSLRSDESVTIRPEVGGRISDIPFKEGQRVSKGTTLVRLDRSVQSADLLHAHATHRWAKVKYDRAIDLKAKGFISSQARDEAEYTLKVAEATIAQAQARLDKTEIRAPFAGTLGLRQVSVGDHVKEGQDIVNLEAIDLLKVDFRVPEVFSKQVQVEQVLQVSLDAFPGQTYAGKVFAINPLVDKEGRALVIRATIANSEAKLRPGMFARVRLLVNENKNSLVIPEQALVPEGDQQFVFKVVNGQAARTRIDIGQRREGKVEVTRGLEPTDTVVTDGQLKIRDGMPVTIANAPAASVSPSAEGSSAKSAAASAPASNGAK